jgi:hypothetical protein
MIGECVLWQDLSMNLASQPGSTHSAMQQVNEYDQVSVSASFGDEWDKDEAHGTQLCPTLDGHVVYHLLTFVHHSNL